MSESTTMTVRLPSQLAKRLSKLSKATLRNKSWLTVDAVRQYLDVQEWQIAETREGLKEANRGEFASPKDWETFLKKWKVRDR